MKRKIRVSKTLSVILLSVALVLCAWRIWYVNATAYSFETQEYGIGEWIPLNGDFFYSKEENTNGYDIIFLDIEMPKLNGIELAKQIRSKLPDVILIFLTSHNEFAPQGYKVKALRYLSKLNMREQLNEALSAAVAELYTIP